MKLLLLSLKFAEHSRINPSPKFDGKVDPGDNWGINYQNSLQHPSVTTLRTYPKPDLIRNPFRSKNEGDIPRDPPLDLKTKG